MAKKTKSLLPKRIGKVKVGRSLRKGALGDLLASKAGQALIAEAVLAAGALSGARLRNSRKGKAVVASARAKGVKAGHYASAAAATFSYALGEAVRSFASALHRPPAERAAVADGPAWAPPAPAPTPRRTRAKRPVSPSA